MKRFWIVLLMVVGMLMVPQIASADQAGAEDMRDWCLEEEGYMDDAHDDALTAMSDANDSRGDCLSYNWNLLSTSERAYLDQQWDVADGSYEEGVYWFFDYDEGGEGYETDANALKADGYYYYNMGWWDDAEEAWEEAAEAYMNATCSYEIAEEEYADAWSVWAALYIWLLSL
jgi:hypothetical protein